MPRVSVHPVTEDLLWQESSLGEVTRPAIHLAVDGESTLDAAWRYPTPLPKADNIGGYVAFDKRKVRVQG